MSESPAGAITPKAEQFGQLVRDGELQGGPVVMLNLLKFKPAAAGAAGSGSEAYARYGEAALRMIEAQGGRLLWSGRADQVLIGDPRQDWDVVLLVQYPSRRAFVEMVTRPEYLEAHADREAALERTVVLACTPGLPALPAAS
jgi:uncharacterized protein (DUF1330 family)